MERTDNSRPMAKLSKRVVACSEAAEYIERYARLIEQNPGTPQRVRDRIGVLIRRYIDPEPPIARMLPEVLAVVLAVLITAALVLLTWIDPIPVHMFAAACVTVLVTHPILVRLYRRWIDRRRTDTIAELEVLLPS